MKGYAVWILMAASVIVAILLHNLKGEDNSRISPLSKSLSGLEQIIPKGSCVSYRSIPADPELLAKVRYVIAPTRLDLTGKQDTTLIITINKDSIPYTGKAIWQHTDSVYHYLLTTTH